MRELWIGMVCVAAAVGCGSRQTAAGPTPETVTTTTTTVTREVRAVEVPSGAPSSLPSFQAAVPAFGENGRCETIADEDGRLPLLSFENGPGGARRNVSLMLDTQGRPWRYSDMRGDLDGNGTGARTAVTADLRNGLATAMNVNTATPVMAVGSTDMALDLANLGTPRAMIERIKRQCGGGAE